MGLIPLVRPSTGACSVHRAGVSKYILAYGQRGVAWSAKREYDKAIADFDEVVRSDPKDVLAYFNRGNAWQAKLHYHRAIADYSEAIRINPRYFSAYVNRGNTWHAMLEYDKAIADFEEAIRLDPRSAIPFFNRANALRDVGKYEDAVASFGEAVRLDPENVQRYINLAWLLATCPKADVRDGKRAVELAKRACELRPGEGDPLDVLAAYAEAGEFDKAVECQERANGLIPAGGRKIAGQERLALYRANKPYHETN